MNTMSKASITRMWIAGLIVLVAGLAMGGISLGLMLANGGTWVPAASGSGSDFVPTINGFFWTTVGFMIVGFTIAVAGGIVQLAAWIGALVNTYQIEDKAWFIILLAGGLLGLVSGVIGFAAMVAYLVAGPDGMPAGRARIAPAPAPYMAQAQPMPMADMPAPAAPQPVASQPPEYSTMR
ncbi:MAG TPA: hypothetical protein VJR48_00920 [Ktedonobacterales bacterium]|nr:hypothetical protein [Ktedonobacterales bacterium]